MAKSKLDSAALTGLAIGDALGMPFESIPSVFENVKQRLNAWDGVSFEGSDFHKLKPGQWTDDTQMTLALATSIRDAGGYDGEKVAQNYLAWYLSGDCRGMGGTTRKAMQNLERGVKWSESGIPGAQGNGTAMRAAPLGLTKDAFKHIIVNAQIDSRITHADREAEWGSSVVALSVNYLTYGGEKENLCNLLFGLMHPNSILLGRLEHLNMLHITSATPAEVIQEFEWSKGAIGHVLETVPAALYSFLWSTDYLSTIVTAIRLGGDTDTTAAIAGAFAGAYYGYDAIPKRCIEQLERADDIRKLELSLLEQ